MRTANTKMLPRAAADEEMREGEMGPDLLGLGLLPPPMAGGGHGGGSAAHQKTGFDEPLRFAADAPLPVRACVRPRPRPVDVDDGVVPAAPPASMPKPPASSTARWAPAELASSPTKVCVPGPSPGKLRPIFSDKS
jgi:hypothetical protein